MRGLSALAAAINTMRIRPVSSGRRTPYRYEKADAGGLWQVILGEQSFLLMRKQPRKNPHRQAFTKAGAFEITGNATTFHTHQAEIFKQLLEKTCFKAKDA